jgi:DHA2 family multidrug resistance protein
MSSISEAAENSGQISAAESWRRNMILLTCTGVTFLYAMTVSIANVALPQMQGALSATADQISWVVTINIVATAVATPISGWLTIRFGRRRLIIGCVAAFALSSLLCGLADSLTALVIYRALQGGFGAPLVPVSQAIIADTFPKHLHGRVMAIFGMGAVMGPVVGPVVGGYLSEAYNWRWVFFMILPFTALALLAAWAFITEKQQSEKTRLDWIGFLSLAVALAALQLMLDRGERADWFESPQIVIYASVVMLAFYIFVVQSFTADNPFLRPSLLLDRNFAFGLVLVFVFGMLNFTPMTILPSMLQQVSGYPDSIIGYILGARGMGTLLAFFLLIWAIKLDPRLLLCCGFILQGYAGWQMASLDVNVGVADIAWPVFWQGFGVGLLWVPITVVAFQTLKPELVPEGTAVFHLLRNIGSSVHIAISLALILRMTKINTAELSEGVNLSHQVMSWAGMGYHANSAGGLAVIDAEVARQSLMIGFIDASYFFAATAFVALPIVFLVKVKK